MRRFIDLHALLECFRRSTSVVGQWSYLTLYGMNGASNFKHTDGMEIASSSTPVLIGMQSRDLFIGSKSS